MLGMRTVLFAVAAFALRVPRTAPHPSEVPAAPLITPSSIDNSPSARSPAPRSLRGRRVHTLVDRSFTFFAFRVELDAAVVQSFAVAWLAHHPARAAQELYCVARINLLFRGVCDRALHGRGSGACPLVRFLLFFLSYDDGIRAGKYRRLVAGGEPAHHVWRRAVFGVHLGDESALIVLLSCGALDL